MAALPGQCYGKAPKKESYQWRRSRTSSVWELQTPTATRTLHLPLGRGINYGRANDSIDQSASYSHHTTSGLSRATRYGTPLGMRPLQHAQPRDIRLHACSGLPDRGHQSTTERRRVSPPSGSADERKGRKWMTHEEREISFHITGVLFDYQAARSALVARRVTAGDADLWLTRDPHYLLFLLFHENIL